MRRRDYLRASGVAAGGVLVAGCIGGGDGGGKPSTYDVSGDSSTQSMTVKMTSSGGQLFEPHVVWIAEGGTVTFTLESGAHSTTSYSVGNDKPQRIPSGAKGWDSGVISSGSFDHTFDVAGVYDYYCIPHETLGMLGSVIVGNPSASGEPGLAAPQGNLPAAAQDEIKKLNATAQQALSG